MEYSPDNYALLPAGTQTLRVDFSPKNSDKYAAVSKCVEIHIEKRIPAVEFYRTTFYLYCNEELEELDWLSNVKQTQVSVMGRFHPNYPWGTLFVDPKTLPFSVHFVPENHQNFSSPVISDLCLEVLPQVTVVLRRSNLNSHTLVIVNSC